MAESSDVPHCPHCGKSLAAPPSTGPSALIFAPEASQTVETEIPVTHCGDDGSARLPGGDGFTLSSPLNGHDVSHRNGRGAKRADESPVLPDSDEFPSVAPSDTSEFDPLSIPVSDPILEVIAGANAAATGPHSSFSADEGFARGRSWTVVLLASYASAMTMAVAWLLWQGNGRTSLSPETLPVPSRLNGGRHAIAPVPEDRRTTLGKPIRVGSLEITPISLRKESVRLEWSLPDGERGEEVGPVCLVLQLRLKNLSEDQTFAPLQRDAILRTDSGNEESFLEIEPEAIEAYPLAVASEKAIIGQSFAPLKPGETIETVIVSEGSGADRFKTAGTWRVKLKVRPDRSLTIGIDVRPEDLQ